MSKDQQAWRYKPADNRCVLGRPDWARKHLGSEGEWLEFENRSAGRYRGARIENDRLLACLFVSRSSGLPPRSWLAELFIADVLTDSDCQNLLGKL